MSKLEPLEQVAQLCDDASNELQLAAKHMQTTAAHFRNREVPRAGAHSLATLGHIESARSLLIEIAIIHAQHAEP